MSGLFLPILHWRYWIFLSTLHEKLPCIHNFHPVKLPVILYNKDNLKGKGLQNRASNQS